MLNQLPNSTLLRAFYFDKGFNITKNRLLKLQTIYPDIETATKDKFTNLVQTATGQEQKFWLEISNFTNSKDIKNKYIWFLDYLEVNQIKIH